MLSVKRYSGTVSGMAAVWRTNVEDRCGRWMCRMTVRVAAVDGLRRYMTKKLADGRRYPE